MSKSAAQTIPEMMRPLPSFDQWLTAHGNGSRGDGFEAFLDLTKRTQEQDGAGYDAAALSMLRMWQGLSIAIVELCNIEHQHGRKPIDIIQIMPRALACAAFYSTASVLGDETPWRSIAKVLAEEFRHAAKVAADEYTESLERAPLTGINHE